MVEFTAEEKSFWKHEDIFNDDPFYYTFALMHEDYSIGLHRHGFTEINLVTNGRGKHVIENKEFDCEKGAVYIIPPNVRHGYRSVDDLNVMHVLLNEKFMMRYSRELAATEGFDKLFEIEPALRAGADGSMFLRLNGDELASLETYLIEMIRLSGENTAASRNMENGLALYVICRLCEIYERDYGGYISGARKISYRFMNVIEYINENYAQNININRIIEDSGISRATFFRLFKKTFNISPDVYLVKYRIKKAKELLKLSDKKITDIAFECGFFDASHFIKCFQKYESVTPKQYRVATNDN